MGGDTVLLSLKWFGTLMEEHFTRYLRRRNKMNGQLVKKLSAAVLMALLAGGLAACDNQGPAEEAGESIDNSMESAGESIESAGESIEDAAEN